jgi:hypothetical protein
MLERIDSKQFLSPPTRGSRIKPARIKRIPAKSIGEQYASPILTTAKAVDHKRVASIARKTILGFFKSNITKRRVCC